VCLLLSPPENGYQQSVIEVLSCIVDNPGSVPLYHTIYIALPAMIAKNVSNDISTASYTLASIAMS
jgi:hypothetical protein